ncbi:type II toxin-antitoxin system RelE family toxin [Corynebacterium mastitidis]|nr:type II toxin-antitoxin system RelE/ParE family toxin [Corynebacterium mastitidis]MDK8450325.1 type II toxin-antitoxin system RelE/ParE family toxin [Corynebacterium mastitidis]
MWRYRVGDYRVVVAFQREEVVILAVDVGHRKEMYR